MAVSETEREEQGVIYGKLIALEGDTEMLATQLQLLPPSQKFLVIPSMPEIFSDKEDFDPRSYVRTVHLAFKDRTERAQAFLRDGTSAHPRLVFMNGGSVSARRRCISRICQDTDGDVGAAEDVFKEIAQDGVAGLMRDMSEQERQTERDAIDGEEEQVDEEEAESPHSKFMKAAESLKRETTSPQTDVTEEGLVSSPAHKLGATQNTEDVPTQGIFTTQHGGEIVRTILTGPSRPATFMDQKRGTFGSQYEEEYDPYAFADVASPGDGSLMSGGPPTPIVIYGEACLVDMASASPTKPRRAASFDTGRFYPSNSRFLEPPSSPGSALKHTTSAYNLRRPRTSEGMQARADGFPKLPRTTFLKASETTIKRSPTSAGSLNSSSTSLLVPAPRIFVDPGTDAKDAMGDTSKTGDSPWESEIFTPVFPVVEDFILQLFDGKPDEILESVIRTSKDGSYPAISQSIPSSPLSEGYDSSTSPLSGSCLRHAYGQPAEPCSNRRNSVVCSKQDEFDPYSYASQDGYPPDIKPRWQGDKHKRVDNTVPTVDPPTPTLTPLPTRGNADRFLDFSPINAGNAISVQNSLRQLLSIHFPAGEYSQYYYPVAPEAERLWKPVFRNDERSSIGNEDRTVDQIVALGCEEGVKRDFFWQISGQIEKLGIKRDGTNRSGKLDVGYLIAQAMRRSSSGGSPSTISQLPDPRLLATLLVPQIEGFLASNISIRFLILHFPFNHLGTVFELRKLLGTDLFKISGVLDSLASNPPPMSRLRTPLSSNPLSNDAIAAQNNSRPDYLNKSRSRSDHLTTLRRQTSFAGGQPKTGATSFAKANFVLPSTATDAEITAFLSGIWKTLMEKSPFYTPEPEPKPVMPERPSPPPPTPSTSSVFTRDARDARDRDSGYLASTYRGTPSKISRLTGNSGAGSQNNYEPSVNSKHKYASSIASTKTTRTERGRRRERGAGATAGAESEWDTFLIGDGDEDSEDDEFDKMILGRAMAKIVPEVRAAAPKRDKKKALKWLGLA